MNRWPQGVKHLLDAFLDRIEVDSKQFVQPYYLCPRFALCYVSGGGRESNPPGSFHPLTGFEDQEGHQAPVASSTRLPKPLVTRPFGSIANTCDHAGGGLVHIS